jgi:NAD-dependent SIR2 family protein deacetylase
MGAWDNLFECGTCGKTFPAGWRARDNHCAATGHSPPPFECDTCPRVLRSEHARYQHMLALGHFAEEDPVDYECRACDWTYTTEEDRDEHEHDDHNYCGDCDRFFRNANNLKQVRVCGRDWRGEVKAKVVLAGRSVTDKCGRGNRRGARRPYYLAVCLGLELTWSGR